jgi:hypothetical protein
MQFESLKGQSNRPDVVAKKVQILGELAPEIDVTDLSQIVKDEPVPVRRSQNLDLVMLERRCAVRKEAVVVEHLVGFANEGAS